jgi:hypothetical protein
MSNTNKSAAPTRALNATAWLLAAVVALEVTGVQALSHGHDRWQAVVDANGDAVYSPVDGAGSADARVVAQAGY